MVSYDYAPCSFSEIKISSFYFQASLFRSLKRGWSGGAMVLGKLPVPRRPTN